MELDNGMVIGAMPYTEPSRPKRFICPWCERPVLDEVNVYRYKGGQRGEEWICADCLKDEVGNMSPDELADALLIDTGRAGDER